MRDSARAHAWPVRLLGRLLPVLPVLLMGSAPTLHAADGPSLDEQKVKAAFLFNFVRFVEWPAKAFDDATSPIVLGVFGNEAFGGEVERLVQDKVVNGRALRVRQIRRMAEIAGCHVLFVAGADVKGAAKMVAQIDGAPILTVGDAPGFAGAGGVINFTREQNYVRFEINVSAASHAGLTLSSKLLRLARIVHEPREGSQ